MIKKLVIVLFAWLFLFLPSIVMAHMPVLENPGSGQYGLNNIDYNKAVKVTEPTEQSLAVYGKIKSGEEVDVYKFTTKTPGSISIELLVPAWSGLSNFRPKLLIVGPTVGERVGRNPPAELKMPANWSGFIVNDLLPASRQLTFEPYSLERLYRGEEVELEVTSSDVYYLLVYSPDKQMGTYSLAVGDIENFEDQSYLGLFSTVISMKLGLFDGKTIPWTDVIALLMVLLGLSLFYFSARHLYINGFTVADPGGLESIFKQTSLESWHSFWFGFVWWLLGQAWLNRVGWLSQVFLFELICFLLLLIFLWTLTNKFKSDWWLVKEQGTNLSAMTRPRHFRFGYRLFQFIWLIMVFFTVWKIILI